VALIEEAEVVGSCAIAQVEIASALTRAVRLNWLEPEEAEEAWRTFLGHWTSFIRLAVTQSLLHRATRLAWEHGMLEYDAVHQATELLWQEGLGEGITLATFDRQLWETAARAGLSPWPETL